MLQHLTTTNVYSEALDKKIEVDRFIAKYKGEQPGPTLIFVAGIHGNEPSGVFALQQAFDEIEKQNLKLNGSVYALAGNLSALQEGIRFDKFDLNRVWTHENIEKIKEGKLQEFGSEGQELLELYNSITEILNNNNGPFYFFDLHTTSGDTIPFMTVNDSLLNRKYTKQYPVPIILGIEEFLNGALLSYVNEKGYVAFGFEGGQHDQLSSIINHKAFVYLSLVFTGCLDASAVDFNKLYDTLWGYGANYDEFYEIFYRKLIKKNEAFKMNNGFQNFEEITAGLILAYSNGKKIKAPHDGKIFMPLYQGKGEDGFFIIRTIPKIFLKLSAVLRKSKFDRLLPLLPGINWASKSKSELLVNLKIARFFTRPFLHLLGYRSRQIDKTHLRIQNREAASRDEDYFSAKWY